MPEEGQLLFFVSPTHFAHFGRYASGFFHYLTPIGEVVSVPRDEVTHWKPVPGPIWDDDTEAVEAGVSDGSRRRKRAP